MPAGIYTVWLEGKSGDPFFQTRRVAVRVHVGGAVRDFSLFNSTMIAVGRRWVTPHDPDLRID